MTSTRDDDGIWRRELDELLPMPSNLTEARHEILRLRDEVIGLQAVVGTLRGEIELRAVQKNATERLTNHVDVSHLIFERDHYRTVAEELKHTTTWRVGKFMLFPVAVLKGLSFRSKRGQE